MFLLTYRIDGTNDEGNYLLFPQPVNISQAHAKCAREGGQLGDVTDTGVAYLFSDMYTFYRNNDGGTEKALAAHRSTEEIPGDTCMVISDSGGDIRTPCLDVGVPICKMSE